MKSSDQASQTIVYIAMAIVSGTGAVALTRHLGLPGPVAASAALAGLILFLGLDMLFARRSLNRAAIAAARDRREQELERVKTESKIAEAVAARDAQKREQPQAARKTPGRTPQLPPLPGSPESKAAAAAVQSDDEAHAAQDLAGMFREAMGLAPAATETAPEFARRKPATKASETDDADLWSLRPAAAAQRRQDEPAQSSLPPFVTGRAASTTPPPLPPMAERASPEPAPEAKPRDADVEVIQDAIKRLLEEVNAAEKKAAAAAAPAPEPRLATEAAIEQSLDALRLTADTMRSAAARQQAPAAAAPPMPPPLPPYVAPRSAPEAWTAAPRQPAAHSPSEMRARELSDAITAGRIDVLLEPILGLEDQRTRHYEVAVRLRDPEGRSLDVFSPGPDLRGTGLLPLFDSVAIGRIAVIARRLDERGKGGSLFSAFSGESVADERFVGELAETLHKRASLATQLVLSFSQADVRAFSTPEWDSLADMRALGFRFAISGITDLDMDFEALADQGFAFVKLDASVFLEGLPAASGRIPSADVCRHLAKEGLTLVVDRIDSEDQRLRIFGFGVLLGQGQLFGGARPVRADVVAANAAA